MTQLISPDTSVTGRITYCLEYGQKVFHVPHKYDNAWDNWTHSIQHTDAVPSDVSVPLWFSYFASFNGVYKNYGHVVVQVPGQGLYSSPWKQGTTHAVLGSIAEVERIYGCKYVGWSEDIANVKVVEGDENMKPWREGIIHTYQIVLGENPSEKQIFDQMNQKTIYNVIESLGQEAQARRDNTAKTIKGFGDIAEQRFKNEKVIADLVGVDNPDDTTSIAEKVKQLKQSGGKIDKDAVINYVKENLK